jgi:hypothetical protein
VDQNAKTNLHCEPCCDGDAVAAGADGDVVDSGGKDRNKCRYSLNKLVCMPHQAIHLV